MSSFFKNLKNNEGLYHNYMKTISDEIIRQNKHKIQKIVREILDEKNNN